MIKYNPAGEILNATVSLVLGFVHEAALPLQQEFQIRFVQVESHGVFCAYGSTFLSKTFLLFASTHYFFCPALNLAQTFSWTQG